MQHALSFRHVGRPLVAVVVKTKQGPCKAELSYFCLRLLSDHTGKMPTVCCIVSCSNKQGKESDLGFFRIPAVKKNEGEETQRLSEKRRRLWFAAINRADSSWKKVEAWRVCGKHFHSGRPSPLYDEGNPDWVPTLGLGYESGQSSKGEQVPTRNLERYGLPNEEGSSRLKLKVLKRANLCQSLMNICRQVKKTASKVLKTSK